LRRADPRALLCRTRMAFLSALRHSLLAHSCQECLDQCMKAIEPLQRLRPGSRQPACRMRPTAPAPAGGWNQLALFLPLTAPVVEGLCRDPGVAGDLSHALAVGRAHAMADLGPHGLVIDRFHGPRFGPLVDGSDRADFFPDAGGLLIYARQAPSLRVFPKQIGRIRW